MITVAGLDRIGRDDDLEVAGQEEEQEEDVGRVAGRAAGAAQHQRGAGLLKARGRRAGEDPAADPLSFAAAGAEKVHPDIFIAFDEDGGGTIDHEELVGRVRRAGRTNDKEFKRMLSVWDERGPARSTLTSSPTCSRRRAHADRRRPASWSASTRGAEIALNGARAGVRWASTRASACATRRGTGRGRPREARRRAERSGPAAREAMGLTEGGARRR